MKKIIFIGVLVLNIHECYAMEKLERTISGIFSNKKDKEDEDKQEKGKDPEKRRSLKPRSSNSSKSSSSTSTQPQTSNPMAIPSKKTSSSIFDYSKSMPDISSKPPLPGTGSSGHRRTNSRSLDHMEMQEATERKTPNRPSRKSSVSKSPSSKGSHENEDPFNTLRLTALQKELEKQNKELERKQKENERKLKELNGYLQVKRELKKTEEQDHSSHESSDGSDSEPDISNMDG
ncbi:MAG: hypothetical protein AB7R69_00375 [Candidatus Babeliales bacterium]